MKYTRNNLNKIGTYLYAEGIDAFKRSEAIKIVSDWYKRYQSEDVYQLCVEEIKTFVDNKNL